MPDSARAEGMEATLRHQEVVLFVAVLLRLLAQRQDLGKVVLAPFEMRMSPNGNVREPDLLFVGRHHLDRLTEERLVGPADLVVEVISDDSLGSDRGDKFYEYQAGGVREYWIVDPRPGWQRVDGFLLEAGRYRAVGADRQGRLASQVVPGFWLEERWLQQEELPDPERVLAIPKAPVFPCPDTKAEVPTSDSGPAEPQGGGSDDQQSLWEWG